MLSHLLLACCTKERDKQQIPQRKKKKSTHSTIKKKLITHPTSSQDSVQRRNKSIFSLSQNTPSTSLQLMHATMSIPHTLTNELPPKVDKVKVARFMFREAKIISTPKIIGLFKEHADYADDIAVSLIFLHKCDLFLSEHNLEDIANAGSRVWDLAVAIAWFATTIDSDIRLMSALIHALVTAKKISDSIDALAIISCYMPLTQMTIDSITQKEDPISFLKLLLTIREVEIMRETNHARATIHTTMHEPKQGESAQLPAPTPTVASGLIPNHFLSSPRNLIEPAQSALYQTPSPCG